MNPLDYDFLEDNPLFVIDHTDPYLEVYEQIPDYFTFNDLKELDPSILNNPSNEGKLQELYIDKVNQKKYNVIQNKVTGEYHIVMTPYRGNESYAFKKHRKLQPIIDTFDKNEFSKPINNTRSSELRMVYAVMITLSFTRSYGTSETTTHGYPVRHWTAWDSWESTKGSNSLINQFKVEMSRHVNSTYGACVVKEGCKDQYPAPHMIVIFDKPIIAHRYGKKWLIGKNMDRELVDKIQSSWERIAGSHCKVVPIIDAKGFSYAFKYIQKSINTKVSSVSEMTESELVCLNTHLNHALHDLNDVISPTFLKRLDYTKELTLLDITRTKLKQTKKELIRLSNEIEEKGGFNHIVRYAYRDLFNDYYEHLKEIERLRIEIYNIKMETSPWFFIRGGFTSIESVESYTSNI